MRAFVVRYSAIERCPIRSLSPSHYDEDGGCRCVRLTDRERSLVQAWADGIRDAEWARSLGLSPHTAKGYGERVRHKLGGNRTVCVAIAIREGLVV